MGQRRRQILHCEDGLRQVCYVSVVVQHYIDEVVREGKARGKEQDPSMVYGYQRKWEVSQLFLKG